MSEKRYYITQEDVGSEVYSNAYVHALEVAVESLREILIKKLHQRKCHDCGHLGWYADSKRPHCLCDKCRSQDTRRIEKEALK